MNSIIDNLANELKGKLVTLQKLESDNFAKMPKDVQERLKGPHIDVNKAIKAINEGDYEALYKLGK